MRFGIIGTGFIGPFNTSALMQCGDVQIAAVANRTVQKARAMCEKLGLACPVYSDWREMIVKEKLDAVVINLFNDLHMECFVACAQAGLHILVEKPLANSYEDCLEMINAARKNKIRASVLHTQRYNTVFQTAKIYIQEHAQQLGKLLGVNDHLSSNYFWIGRNPWHLDPVRSGGGIVLNNAVHQLDRVHWFMGQKTKEFHTCYLTEKPGIATISSFTMMGVGEGDTPYTVVGNGYSSPVINEMLLTFQNGVIKCVLAGNGANEMGLYVGDNDTGKFHAVPLLGENGEGGQTMYNREMREAVDYLQGKTDEPPISLEWGAEMVRLCCLGL